MSCYSIKTAEHIPNGSSVSESINATGGKVVKIYHGNTILIETNSLSSDSPVYRFYVKLRGVDIPSIGIESSEHDKEIAYKSYCVLSATILGKTVSIRNVEASTIDNDPLIADVFLESYAVQKEK